MSEAASMPSLEDVKPELATKWHLRLSIDAISERGRWPVPATGNIDTGKAAALAHYLVNRMRETFDEGRRRFTWDNLTVSEIGRVLSVKRRQAQYYLRYLEQTILKTTSRSWQSSTYEILAKPLIQLGRMARAARVKAQKVIRGRAVTGVRGPTADQVEVPPENWRGQSPETIFEIAFSGPLAHLGLNKRVGRNLWSRRPAGATVSEWARDCELVARAITEGATPRFQRMATGKPSLNNSKVWTRAVGEARLLYAHPDAPTEDELGDLVLEVGDGPPATLGDRERLIGLLSGSDATTFPQYIQRAEIDGGRLVVPLANRWQVEHLAELLGGAGVPLRLEHPGA